MHVYPHSIPDGSERLKQVQHAGNRAEAVWCKKSGLDAADPPGRGQEHH